MATLSRLAAALTAVLAVLVTIGLVTSGPAPEYGVLLVGTLVLVAAWTATRLWRSCSFESRLATVTVTGITLVGQLLVAVVGGPSGAAPQWHGTGVATAAVAVVVLGVVALDSHLRSRAALTGEQARHPYAL